MRNLLALGIVVGASFGLSSQARAVVQIDVDLTTQHMRVSGAGGANYDWAISSGRKGHLTPRGVFSPQAMYPMVHSFKYNNAPMPHAIFFHGPFAIHATNAVMALGHPASHGCVRISPENAAVLYDLVRSQGARITISGDAPVGRVAANDGRAGHRLAALARKRLMEQPAMAYSEPRGPRTLKQWLKNPAGTR